MVIRDLITKTQLVIIPHLQARHMATMIFMVTNTTTTLTLVAAAVATVINTLRQVMIIMNIFTVIQQLVTLEAVIVALAEQARIIIIIVLIHRHRHHHHRRTLIQNLIMKIIIKTTINNTITITSHRVVRHLKRSLSRTQKKNLNIKSQQRRRPRRPHQNRVITILMMKTIPIRLSILNRVLHRVRQVSTLAPMAHSITTTFKHQNLIVRKKFKI